MAKVQFNQSMQEEVAEFNEFEALLESIKKREVMTNQYSLITTIKYVGGYQLGGVGGLRINFKTKPLWFHRMMMKLCLGWTWVDTK